MGEIKWWIKGTHLDIEGGMGRGETAGRRGNLAGGRPKGIKLRIGVQNLAEREKHVGWREKYPLAETCPP